MDSATSAREEEPDCSGLCVVGLAGSLRPGSYTVRAVEAALAGAARLGATTDLVDLRELDLPLMNGRKGGQEDHPGVRELAERVRRAQGVVLGTPEYHGSFSGVVKNALDHLGFDEMEGRVVGLVSVSGGAMGGLAAMDGLRTVMRALHAWVVPHQAGVPRAHSQFQSDGGAVDEGMAKRLERVGEQVARFAHLHHAKEAKAFLAAWEAAVENPGAR